jgi:hypothetical protein
MLDSIASKPIAPSGQEPSPEKQASNWASWYRVAAYAVFNAILLCLVLNLLLFAFMHTGRRGTEDDSLQKYGDRVLTAYPGWHEKDIRILLKETYRDATMEYEPFTVFRNRPLNEKFVHVDAAGFRLSKNQAPWPPRPENFNVYVFGGSTTFGMGLADDETIASYLQIRAAAKSSHQPLAVYNFARTYYFSSQERILFQQLLLAGYVPRVAVFVDGLNDFGFPDGQPRFTDRLRRFMAGQAQPGSNPLDSIPMVKAAHSWTASLINRPSKQAAANLDGHEPDPAQLEGVAARWLGNKKMVELLAAGYGVRPIFVWQPVPTYQYDLRYHLLSSGYTSGNPSNQPDDYALKENLWHQGRLGPSVMGVADGYKIMDNLRGQGKLGSDVLWLADMQQDKHENLYVDAVHYNAAFSKEIAERIYAAINQPPTGM